MVEITVNYDTCEACGTCVDSCPAQVYDKGEDGKPIVARPDECMVCHTCMEVCPTGSITVQEL
ncbi:MAG: 4Fe-4S ferredoxin [Thermodesulfobacteriota bacterium]|nr:MAG: 4Fe-4S ferredoxin [Thermodesulfobacteriota bacterium]